MLKLISILIFLFFIVGCNSEEDVNVDPSLPVTSYFAIEDSLGADEWQDFITVAVNTANIITAVEFNSITRLANDLRRDIAQLEGFEDVFEYNFHEQALLLEDSLIGIPSDELVNAIRDAYDDEIVDFDTATFADLADRALRYGELPAERGGYLDGAYHSITEIDEDENENDLQYFINFYVIHGNIVAVHFNAVDHEGFLKYDQRNAYENDILEWRHQAHLLEQTLIRLQDPMELSFDNDGYATDIPGVYVEIETFVSLVIQALADGPVVNEIDVE